MANEIVIPRVPFRRITEAEKDEIRAYFKEDLERNNDEFWQQTEEEARGVLRTIKEGGFVVGGELSWGDPVDSYGVRSHIYSRNYSGKNIEKFCDYSNVIGNVDLWEGWGFSSNPVKVWYQNPDLVDDSFGLRDYLMNRGLSFVDSVDTDRLRRQIAELESEKVGKQRILSRLRGLELKTD